MRFDDLVKHLGEFGTYQKRTYFLLCYPMIIAAFHKLMWVFVAAEMAHICQPFSDDDSNTTSRDQYLDYLRNSSLPKIYGNKTLGSCMVYEKSNNSSGSKCSSWVYDTSQYKSSVVSDFDLVCDRKWLSALTMSLQMAGEFIGSVFLGILSDKFGRKTIIVLSSAILSISGLLTSFSTGIVMLIICRIMVGFWTPGAVQTAFVIGIEFVGPSKRVFAGIVSQYFFAVGNIIIALVAYFIRDWRSLIIALSIPGLLMISYYWLIGESVRWLLTNNRKDRAIKLIKKIAKINKVHLSDEFYLNEFNVESKPQASLRELMIYPNLRKRTFIVVYCWFVNTCVYYGLSLNTSNLAGNNYINFIIASAVELPAYTLCLLTLDRIGRRIPLCSSMIIAGIALFIVPFLPSGSIITIILAMIGKCAITASYAIIYMFTTEVFPTSVRSASCGLGSTCGRVGAMLAPFMLLLTKYWPPLTPILFSFFALTAGCLCLLLPETLGRELPDTIDDGENFTKRGWDKNEVQLLTNGLLSLKASGKNNSLEMQKTNIETH